MSSLRLLRLAPWRRGPWLLLRRPGVAVALLAAALVAALPAAAAPMFLSSAQHATLHRQIDRTCQWLVGAQFDGPFAPFDPDNTFGSVLGPGSVVGTQRFQQRVEAVAAHRVDGLTVPVSTGYGQVNAELVDRPLPLPDLRALTLLGRDGFQEHVEVLAGPVGEGLWFPDERARQQGIEVGDELRLTRRSRETGSWSLTDAPEPAAVTMPVAAIYRDLRARPDTPYWCGVSHIYRGSEDINREPPPPAALVDTATFLEVGEATQFLAGQVVELSVDDPELTAPEAERLASEVDALQTRMLRDYPELYPTAYRTDRTRFISYLDRFQQRAGLVRSGLLPPVVPITAAGTSVGLAVVAAAGVFWVQRRRRELLVLAAHGVGTGALGAKAAAEAVPAVVAGTAAGWAAAWGLVAAVGPSPVLSRLALPLAGVAALVIGLMAAGLIGRLAAAGARGLTDARPVTHRRGWWTRVWWELGLLAAAPMAWWLLAEDRTVDEAAGGVGAVLHVPARLLVVPILLIGGSAALAGRLAAARLRGHRLGRVPAGAGRLLAWRRLVRAASTTAILAAATAVPVAMAAYGGAATGSIRTTADAQLRYSLGSDTIVTYRSQFYRGLEGLPPPPPPPPSLVDQSTEVIRLNQQRLGGLIVDVLGVDPATFADGAFWDDRIAGASLADAVRQLSVDATPQVVASRRIAPGPQTLTVREEQIPVHVMATRPVPGAQSAYPLVLIHRDALAAALSDATLDLFSPQVWIAGDPTETRAQLATATGQAPERVITIEQLRAGALYEPVTYTFQYLIALSVFTGLISAVGLLLYLESRTTAHRRAYVLLRRLGLRPGAHRRALLLEVGVPVVSGLASGIAAALALAYGLRSGFDLDPGRFPGTVLALPTALAAAVTAAAVTVAIGASLLAHARIARANPAEVLRDAD